MAQDTKLNIKAKSKILEGLNKEQQEAVVHGEGPLLIVAGAGTGKTTVITRRIAYLIEKGVKPDAILAMAFGEKAAAEMAERVDLLLPYGYYNLQVSTFHSFCERILKEYGLEIGLPDFKVLNEVGQWLLIRNNLEKFELDYYRPIGNPTRFIRALVSHFARCKDELIAPAGYLKYGEGLRLNSDRSEAENLTPTLSASGEGENLEEVERIQEVANAYHVYQRLLLQNQALDFGDLINYTLELFKKRPKILEILRKQYEYILIDEFQDTNYAQYELVKLLAQPKNNLTVVGDDDQSIFKFRGASISNILHFKKDYKAATFISLTQNYRSGQKILDMAHEFVRQNDPDRLEVKLRIDKKLKSQVSKAGTLEALTFPDYIAEAQGVIEKILEIKNRGLSSNSLPSSGEEGRSWNDFAILARSNDALEPFINALDERQIPHIYFANRGLYRKPIVLDLLYYFRLLDNYHESGALYRVLNFEVFGVSHGAIIELSHFAKKKSISLYEALRLAASLPNLKEQDLKGIHKLLNFLDKHTRLAKEKSVSQVFVEVLSDLDFSKQASENSLSGIQNAKYLQAFSRKIQNFQTESADKSLKVFMAEINFEIDAGGTGELEFDSEAGPEAVKLMTAHGAKGLEFTHVFVVSLVDKRFPTIERREQIEVPDALIKDILPEGDVHLEEERRLMYVAMTRAKEGLYLTRAGDYGGKQTKRPSRFLIELGLAREVKTKPTGEVSLRSASVRLGRTSADRQALPIPKYFSFSQISLFKSCPLEYKYRYILGLPTKGNAALSFGLTIHDTFEKYLKLLKQRAGAQDLFGQNDKRGLPEFSALEKYYEDSWIGDWFESKKQMEDYRELGKKMLKMFYEEAKENRPQPKYLEQSFRLRLRAGWFIGKIDRADETPQGLLIIDYKTGQARGINKVDKEQLLIYQWAAQEFFREKVADLQYWFLKDKLKKESFIGEQKDIDKLKAEIESTVGEIIEATKTDSFFELDQRISHECAFRDLIVQMK